MFPMEVPPPGGTKLLGSICRTCCGKQIKRSQPGEGRGLPSPPSLPEITSLFYPCGLSYCGCLFHPSGFKNEPLGAFLASPAKCCAVNITRQACSKPLKSTSSAPPALWDQAAAKYSQGCFPFIKCELCSSFQVKRAGRGVRGFQTLLFGMQAERSWKYLVPSFHCLPILPHGDGGENAFGGDMRD